MEQFPRTLYKHQDPLTMTIASQDEQDKYTAEGWTTAARPQEQIDQSEYLREHPEAVEPAASEAEAEQIDNEPKPEGGE